MTFLKKLRANLARRRVFQLFRTAYTIWQRDGLHAFTDRLRRWLGGERRYYRPLEWLAYEKHCQTAALSADQLTAQRETALGWRAQPTFAILTPVYNAPLYIFKQTAAFVTSQSYPNWRWYVADASTDATLSAYITQLAATEPRIVLIRLPENGGISANTNAALNCATEDFLLLLDHDDLLAPEALFEVAHFLQSQPNADLIYSDSDKVDAKGRRFEPLFKPDWSPELLLCANYIRHLSVFRREVALRVGQFDSALDGAQDWDYFLRLSEVTQCIYHLPKVLYHWRAWEGSTAQARGAKHYAAAAQIAAVENHLKRTGIAAPHVFFDAAHPIRKFYPYVQWEQPQPRRIAIIIPSRDHADVLGSCLGSLFRLTDYPHYRVIVVDTGSREQVTADLYARYAAEPRFSVVHYSAPFNFSRACNFGAQHAADADLLLFLNNDTEILAADWLARMAQWFEREKVGIVGAKLLYPSGEIQHGGVIVGLSGMASHAFMLSREAIMTHFGSDDWYRNYLAVTGACLMIAQPLFEQIGGFDEAYQLIYSDVEICLRAVVHGYRVVYTPDVRLIHYESLTHQRRVPYADFLRADQHFKTWIERGDPYYNPNLSHIGTLPNFSANSGERAAHLNAVLMARLRAMPEKGYLTLPDDLA
ncbi:MAG: glycosyltransferase [Chloroflexi bacterium CFX4]|nr:glycosyltransferase [Chloroflexi bacterium CFX4]MDL1923863.1 glycosyltransferase [Chloroflexi bacterium CFX3]